MWRSIALSLNPIQQNYTASLCIINFFSGQTVYSSNQSAHWSLLFCVSFLFFIRFPLSLIIRVLQDWLPLRIIVTKGVFLLALHLSKVKLWACHPLVDVLDVITGGLKVSRCIVGPRDEDLEGNKSKCALMSQSKHREITKTIIHTK